MSVQVEALLTQWRTERDVLDERIGLAEQLLATFTDDGITEMAVPLTGVVNIVGTIPPSRGAPVQGAAKRTPGHHRTNADGYYECPECGGEFDTPKRLGAHRRHLHPRMARETGAVTRTNMAQVACPDCGRMFSPMGLGAHRAFKHPGSAAKPIVAPSDTNNDRPHITADPTIQGKVFTCDDCGREEPNIRLLQRHTHETHDRALLTRDERTPGAPLGLVS